MSNLFFNNGRFSSVTGTGWKFFSRRGEFLSNATVFWNGLLSLAIIIVLVLFIFLKLKPGSGTVPLHYNVLIGIDVVNSGWWILAMPALSLVFTVINFYFAKRFYKFEPVASYFLAFASTVQAVMFLIAAIALSKIY